MVIYVGNTNVTATCRLVPDENLYTGAKSLADSFGSLNSLEEDMLNLAAGIYGADLAIKRKEREQFIRTIDFNVEIVNFHALERVKDKLKYALQILSKDNWRINFIPKKGNATSSLIWGEKKGVAVLFSGGLDSMCAVSELIRKKNEIVLVSHVTHGNREVDDSQKKVHRLIETHYRTKIEHIQVKVYGRNKGDYSFPDEREITQRTRSFLYLTLGALVARRCGFNKVLFMAENGQFAIHLPLNHARVGPFSTHTADPEFLEIAEEIFRTVLGNSSFEIVNPFLYKTKAEVVSLLPSTLRKKCDASITCWMFSRKKRHCGECIPCISRRIALEYNGIKFNEYYTDLFSTDIDALSDEDNGKRNIIDYLEFISKFRNVAPATIQDILFEFPELINSSIDQEKALKLYQRLAEQSFKVFSIYPQIMKVV
ncbi:MAG: 7-cyano-7-deazaguanine synthase [Patescibacteria group bacterium]